VFIGAENSAQSSNICNDFTAAGIFTDGNPAHGRGSHQQTHLTAPTTHFLFASWNVRVELAQMCKAVSCVIFDGVLSLSLPLSLVLFVVMSFILCKSVNLYVFIMFFLTDMLLYVSVFLAFKIMWVSWGWDPYHIPLGYKLDVVSPTALDRSVYNVFPDIKDISIH
jgi:hypothetical protein